MVPGSELHQNLLARGVAWASCIALLIASVIAAIDAPGSGGWVIVPAVFAICVAGWIGLLTLAWKTIDGSTSVMFAMLAHLSVAAYLSGVVLVVGGLMAGIDSIHDSVRWDDDWELLTIGLSVLALFGGIACFYAGRRFERMVAEHCIRIYLQRRSTS